MSTIKLSIWFMWKGFINGIKRTWKITLAIIGIFVFMVGIGVVIGTIVGGDSDEKQTQYEEEPKEEKDEKDEINEEFDIVRDEEGNEVYVYYKGTKNEATMFIPEMISAIVCIIVITSAIWKGAKKGVDIFTMPDVNFLFPAPIKPQSVLLFRIIMQVGTTFLGLIYFVYQIPNLMNIFNISISSILMIIICFLILMITSKFINVSTYCVLSKTPRIKKVIAKYGFAIGFIPFLAVSIIHYGFVCNLYDSIYAVFGSVTSRIIPFYGWLKAACAYAFMGRLTVSLLFIMVTIVGAVFLVWLTWKMDVDFYEDALKNVTIREEQIESVMQQAQGGTGFGVKHEGKRQMKKWDRIRNNILSFTGYEGAKVLFCKTIVNRKRFYPLKGLWSNTCNLYFFVSFICAMFGKYVLETNPADLIIILLLGIMFFRSFVNPMAEETEHMFIYLMPENPYKIIGWGMAGQVLEYALDVLPASIILLILNNFSPITILWYLILVSTNLFFGMTALMVDLVFSYYLPVVIINMLQLIVRVVPVLPIIIVTAVGILTSNISLALIMVIMINVVMSVLCYIPCSIFLFKGKR